MAPITAASTLSLGQGHLFTDPATNQPAWLVHLNPHTYKAFSAICTHAGCTVNFSAAAQEFICPCHRGTYNAKNGQVIAGPPPAPLPPIPLQVTNGTIHAR